MQRVSFFLAVKLQMSANQIDEGRVGLECSPKTDARAIGRMSQGYLLVTVGEMWLADARGA